MSDFINIPILSWGAPVTSSSVLPVSAQIGEARVVLDSNTVYVFSNGTWNALPPTASPVFTGTVTAGSALLVNTSAPITTGDKVTVVNEDSTGTTVATFVRYSSSLAGAASQIRMLRGRGTSSSPAVPQSGDNIATISHGGYNGTGWSNSANIVTTATETWTSSARGTQVVFNAAPTGQTSVTTRILLTGDGAVTLSPNLLFQSDNSKDIGSNDAGVTFKRPSAVYVGTKISLGGTNFVVNQATVNTTDATATTLQSIDVPNNSMMLVECRVTALRTGGLAGSPQDSAIYVITARLKNVAGTVTVNGLSVVQNEDQAAWDATLDVSATTVRIQVTGAADNNITWKTTTLSQVG